MSIFIICNSLARRRYDLTVESTTQQQIAEGLTTDEIRFEREVVIGPRERVDFLCQDGVAIEVKLQGQAKKIYRQLERYAESDSVKGIILATAKTINLPIEIKGKPCLVVPLGRSWL